MSSEVILTCAVSGGHNNSIKGHIKGVGGT